MNTIKEALDYLISEEIVQDVRDIWTELTLGSKSVYTDNSILIADTLRCIESNYDGLTLSPKNTHVLTKPLEHILTKPNDAIVSSIRLADMFIVLVKGNLDLTKYKNKCAATTTGELIYYTDHTPKVLGVIICLDDTILKSPVILAHEITHAMLNYKKLIQDDDTIDDVLSLNGMAIEFICDIISNMAINGDIWEHEFEKMLPNINSKFSEFYNMEYSLL